MSSPPPQRALANRLLKILGAFVAALVIFVAGVIVGGHPAETGLDRLREGKLRSLLIGDRGRDLSEQVLDLLERAYYKPIDADRLERRSVEAMLELLDDPYTYYLDEDALAALRQDQNGTYSGVGLTVARRDEHVVVTSVHEGGPADKAGVKAGDLLVSVEGEPVRGVDLDVAVAKIKGPEGTQVRIGFRTPGEPVRELTLTRAEIKIQVVSSRKEVRRGTTLGYVRLSQFTRGSAAALRKAVRDLVRQKAEALVLDLRHNPGGLLAEAVDVGGVFLPYGTPVVITEGENEPRTTLKTDEHPLDTRVPLVVLVDQSSASASEVVAGALRDASRARLVGTRTFGKALVQSTRLLDDGGALKLTTARYLTPSGFDLGERGLPPQVRAQDDPDTPPDEALERALAVAAAAARG